MNISEMFSDSYISYPFSNPGRIVVLGVLFCTGVFLIVPAVFAVGYLVRIIENTINGNYELPPFENWKKMFIDGLKFITITTFYILPGIVCFLTAFFLALGKNTLILDSWLIFGLMVLAGILVFLGYILSLLAIPHMVYKNQLKAAFEIKILIKEIKCIGLKKYALSLAGFSIMAAYLILFGGFLHDIFYSISTMISLNVFITDSIANLMIYPLLIASQGRLMGLIYLERAQSYN